jgi:hypothetical protein
MTATPETGARPATAWAITLAPTLLAILAEAAWISVVAGLVQVFGLRMPDVGIPALAVVVGIGAIAARAMGPRLGVRWPLAAFALVVVAAAVGWLVSPEARAALPAGLGPALAAHPGGLFAGLAMLRGFAHARVPPAEGTLARMLGFGVPGLALAALLGGAISEPYRSAFLAQTLAASILFIGCTVLALAFARLGAIGDDQGLDWRRNPIWLAVSFGLLLAVLALALPLAVIAPTVISVVVGLLLGPIIVIGLFTGLDRSGRRVLLILVPVIVIIWIRSLFRGGEGSLTNPTPTLPGDVSDPTAVQIATIGVGGILLLGLVALILLLAALWMRRRRPADDELVPETRVVDRGGADETAGRPRRRWWRRPQPANAVEAYVALVADIDRHAGVRRTPAETPREHAARLRASGVELALDLLAADYALVRDAGRTLSPHEERRAIDRWRALRKRLTRRPVAPEGVAAEAEVTPVTGDAMEAGRRSVRSG